jgi:anti-sigma B factor antagonist
MVLKRRTAGPVEILKFPSRADASIAPDARADLQGVIDEGRFRLVFDLSEVELVDSSGLSVLVTAVKKARGAGGDVALVRLTDSVRSLIERTHLQSAFSIFDDVDAAVAELSKS